MSVDVAAPAPAHRGAAATAGLAALAVASVLVASMHVLAPWSRHDPVRRTISEYAVGPGGWLFDLAVLAVAAATVLVVVDLVRARLVAPVSAPTLLLGTWALGLVLVVVFEKTNWSIGPSLTGTVHRYASLAAFVALPVGVAAAVRRGRGHPRGGPPARLAGALAAVSGLAFTPILLAVLTAGLTGVPWYRAIPLGLVERVLVLAEVLALAALAWWARRSARDGARDGATG